MLRLVALMEHGQKRWIGALTLSVSLLAWTGPSHAGHWPSQAVSVRQRLDSESPTERRQAAAKLAILSPGLARPLVLEALQHDDAVVRRRGAQAALTHRFSAAVSVVVDWLGAPEVATRALALRVIAIQPTQESLQELGRAVKDPDPTVRELAVRALVRSPQRLRERATRLVLPALDDDERAVRAAAAEALGRMGAGDSSLVLSARLRDPEAEVRLAAAVALGVMGDARVVGPLILALDDRDASVAAAAARSLGWIGDESAVGALGERIEREPESPLARAGTFALAQIGGPRASEVLVEHLMRHGSSHELIEVLPVAARASLEKCLESLAPELVKNCAAAFLLTGGEPVRVVQAVRQGRLPTAGALDLIRLTADPRLQSNQEVLVLALAQLSEGAAAERESALALLDELDPVPVSAVQPLADFVQSDQASTAEIASALRLLARLPVEQRGAKQFRRAVQRADEVASALLESTHAAVKAAAWQVHLQANPTAERVEQVMQDQASLVRQAACEQLSRGMPPALARWLLQRLATGRVSSRTAFLRALEGLPQDLPQPDVDALFALTKASHGPQRAALLSHLERQENATPYLEHFVGSALLADRLALAQRLAVSRRHPRIAKQLAQDASARVKSVVLPALPSKALDRAQDLLEPETPAYARAFAALELTERGQAPLPNGVDQCQGPQAFWPLGTISALRQARGQSCGFAMAADALLLHPHPEVRQTAVQLVGRSGRDERHALLRSCVIYEVDPAVAAACQAQLGGTVDDEPSASPWRVLLDPLTSRPAPLTPFVLRETSSGRLMLGHSDAGARFRVPEEGRWLLVDSSLAY